MADDIMILGCSEARMVPGYWFFNMGDGEGCRIGESGYAIEKGPD